MSIDCLHLCLVLQPTLNLVLFNVRKLIFISLHITSLLTQHHLYVCVCWGILCICVLLGVEMKTVPILLGKCIINEVNPQSRRVFWKYSMFQVWTDKWLECCLVRNTLFLGQWDGSADKQFAVKPNDVWPPEPTGNTMAHVHHTYKKQ